MTEYLTELMQFPASEYFHPNFSPTRPTSCRSFFAGRRAASVSHPLVLAATLSPAYGIYNGFELCENTPIPGREEYLNSEKYEYKVWDWDRPGNIKDDIRTINRLRRDNPVMQEFLNLRFLPCAEPDILAYAKLSADQADAVVVVVNLDPHMAHQGEVELPLAALGLETDDEFTLEEAFSGDVSVFRGARQQFRLDPQTNPALIFRLQRPASA